MIKLEVGNKVKVEQAGDIVEAEVSDLSPSDILRKGSVITDPRSPLMRISKKWLPEKIDADPNLKSFQHKQGMSNVHSFCLFLNGCYYQVTRVDCSLAGRLYYIRHFSLKTFGLMHFSVIDTPIMSPTEGFLICVSLSGPSMTLLW